MKITIEISTEGSAFEPQPGVEAARILKRLAGFLDTWGVQAEPITLRDVYGNTCGKVEFSPPVAVGATTTSNS